MAGGLGRAEGAAAVRAGGAGVALGDGRAGGQAQHHQHGDHGAVGGAGQGQQEEQHWRHGMVGGLQWSYTTLGTHHNTLTWGKHTTNQVSTLLVEMTLGQSYQQPAAVQGGWMF